MTEIDSDRPAADSVAALVANAGWAGGVVACLLDFPPWRIVGVVLASWLVGSMVGAAWLELRERATAKGDHS